MILSCFIVDDQITAVEHIAEYARRCGLIILGQETDPYMALQKIITMEIKPDVVFLDISMPGLSGLDFATQVEGITRIIFTTGHRDYGAEAYGVNAVYYLLKPIVYEDFLRAVQKAITVTESNYPGYRNLAGFFRIPGLTKGSFIRLEKKDITLLKSAEHYVLITSNGKQHMAHRSMKEILNDLGGFPFVRVHKSYAVNVDQVMELKDNIIHLFDGSKADLGASFRDAFLKMI